MERIYNTVGAAKYLRCGVDNVHKLVGANKLKAHVYGPDGELIERDATKKQGQGLFFLQSDLDSVQGPRKIRRSRRSA